jgi:hypothetical protein
MLCSSITYGTAPVGQEGGNFASFLFVERRRSSALVFVFGLVLVLFGHRVSLIYMRPSYSRWAERFQGKFLGQEDGQKMNHEGHWRRSPDVMLKHNLRNCRVRNRWREANGCYRRRLQASNADKAAAITKVMLPGSGTDANAKS